MIHIPKTKAVILAVKSELNQDDFDSLLALVSPEKQERIKKFRFVRDAQNCLLGDVLARFEICRIIGFGNSQLEFAANEYGKPFLANAPHIHYNISHAGSYVAFAISDAPVGIDIESVKPVDLKIAERFFTLDETAYIMEGDQICRFYEVWTKKESRIKWEGRDLHMPLTSFSVFGAIERERVFYHKVYENGEVICHVCSKKSDEPSVEMINADMLLQCEIPHFI